MDDPVLAEALRKLRTAQSRAEKAGTPIAPEDAEAFLREETKGKFGMADAQKLLTSIDAGIGPRNLVRSAIQGATFDFGDELLGALPERLGGGTKGKEEMRLRQDLFREQHPIADAAAGVGGGLATALLIPGSGAATVGKTIARGAMYGAGAGAAYGLGRGEGNLMDRAPGAVVPAAAGAVLGGALPAIASSLKSLTPAARALRRMSHAVEESGGANVVRGAANDMELAGRGNQAMVADLTDRLRLEGDFAVNNSDDVLAKVAPEVMARQKNAAPRLLRDAVESLGGRPNFPARTRELKLDVQQFGREAYGGLREANPTVPLRAETVKVLGQPVVRQALANARKTGMIGDAPDMGKPSFQHLQDVKESLDDAVAEAFRGGHGNLVTRLGQARDAIVGEMEKVDGYASIAAEYGAKKNAQRALLEGAKAWNVEDPDALAQTMSSMAPEALDQFRYGLAAKMIAKLRNVKTNRDAAKEIMDRSDAMGEKLKVVFGNDASLNRYLFRVEQEAKLAKAKGMFGNSATARRLQSAGFDPVEMGLSAADGGLPTGANLLAKLYSKAKAPTDRATARRVGDMATIKGTKSIEDFLATLANPDPVLGKLGGRSVPLASGGLLHLKGSQ